MYTLFKGNPEFCKGINECETKQEYIDVEPEDFANLSR